jgi:hypothetical protein
MSTHRVTRKKLPDPFHDLIQARIALKWAREQRLASRRPIPAVYALRDLADYMRAHPVTVLIMEARL